MKQLCRFKYRSDWNIVTRLYRGPLLVIILIGDGDGDGDGDGSDGDGDGDGDDDGDCGENKLWQFW